jgi:hypothetical protein
LLQSASFLVVVVSGTENTTQQILNIVRSSLTSYPGVAGMVGTYWGQTALYVWSVLLPSIVPHLAGRRVIFLGHSLGACVAMIMAALFLGMFPATPCSVMTIGAPKPGDPTFAASIDAITSRWENVLDPVTAIPPNEWNPIASAWPISGPLPLLPYAFPGQAATVGQDGTITPGSRPMSTIQAAYAIANLFVEPHSAGEYARRLRAQLLSIDLTPEINHYVAPQILDPNLDLMLGVKRMPSPVVPAVTPTYRHVTICYNYGQNPAPGGVVHPSCGITEEFWTTMSASDVRATVVAGYLNSRFSFAVDLFSFAYARISDVATPRQVDFMTPSDVGGVRQGQIATGPSVGGARGSADTSALLLRMKLAIGPSARIFLHGFDGTQDNEGTFTPNGSFSTNIGNFIAFLKTNGIVYSYAQPVGPGGRKYISAIAGISPRGAQLTLVGADVSLTPGTVINIGGIGRQMQGIAGRKAITKAADPASLVFNVGGAQPVGSYTGTNGWYYVVNPQYQPVSYGSVEYLTSHRVGRPFAAARGRRPNRLPLRQ